MAWPSLCLCSAERATAGCEQDRCSRTLTATLRTPRHCHSSCCGCISGSRWVAVGDAEGVHVWRLLGLTWRSWAALDWRCCGAGTCCRHSCICRSRRQGLLGHTFHPACLRLYWAELSQTCMQTRLQDLRLGRWLRIGCAVQGSKGAGASQQHSDVGTAPASDAAGAGSAGDWARQAGTPPPGGHATAASCTMAGLLGSTCAPVRLQQ